MKTISILTFAALLAGCAAETAKSNGPSERLTDQLAAIQVIKTQPTATKDCPVTVKVTNKMGIDWDGVSYQLGAMNKLGVATGQIIGAPRHATKPGATLTESNQVLGVPCDKIVNVSVLYFSYYPVGKNAVHIHNVQVKAQLK
ncbi:hypothetical protein [Novimethylophilus kurashikiensis]|nr:hypothetical protein [Novimethylophilus kurashikiensis]